MEQIYLLSLNIWGGKLAKDLETFIEQQKDTIDIFCFQEVFHTDAVAEWSGEAKINILNDLRSILADDFVMLYHPAARNCDYENRTTNNTVEYGLCSFVRAEKFKIHGSGERYVFKTKYAGAEGREMGLNNRNVQYLELEYAEKEFVVLNFHGLWTDGGKDDTDERLLQSQKVRDVMCRYNQPMILCGDFNLSPHTQSMAILETDLRNLIKEYDVRNTRSSHYTKENRFADYILISNEITVHEFKVLEDEVSDHLPLRLSFSLT